MGPLITNIVLICLLGMLSLSDIVLAKPGHLHEERQEFKYQRSSKIVGTHMDGGYYNPMSSNYEQMSVGRDGMGTSSWARSHSDQVQQMADRIRAEYTSALASGGASHSSSGATYSGKLTGSRQECGALCQQPVAFGTSFSGKTQEELDTLAKEFTHQIFEDMQTGKLLQSQVSQPQWFEQRAAQKLQDLERTDDTEDVQQQQTQVFGSDDLKQVQQNVFDEHTQTQTRPHGMVVGGGGAGSYYQSSSQSTYSRHHQPAMVTGNRYQSTSDRQQDSRYRQFNPRPYVSSGSQTASRDESSSSHQTTYPVATVVVAAATGSFIDANCTATASSTPQLTGVYSQTTHRESDRYDSTGRRLVVAGESTDSTRRTEETNVQSSQDTVAPTIPVYSGSYFSQNQYDRRQHQNWPRRPAQTTATSTAVFEEDQQRQTPVVYPGSQTSSTTVETEETGRTRMPVVYPGRIDERTRERQESSYNRSTISRPATVQITQHTSRTEQRTDQENTRPTVSTHTIYNHLQDTEDRVPNYKPRIVVSQNVYESSNHEDRQQLQPIINVDQTVTREHEEEERRRTSYQPVVSETETRQHEEEERRRIHYQPGMSQTVTTREQQENERRRTHYRPAVNVTTTILTEEERRQEEHRRGYYRPGSTVTTTTNEREEERNRSRYNPGGVAVATTTHEESHDERHEEEQRRQSSISETTQDENDVQQHSDHFEYGPGVSHTSTSQVSEDESRRRTEYGGAQRQTNVDRTSTDFRQGYVQRPGHTTSTHHVTTEDLEETRRRFRPGYIRQETTERNSSDSDAIVTGYRPGQTSTSQHVVVEESEASRHYPGAVRTTSHTQEETHQDRGSYTSGYGGHRQGQYTEETEEGQRTVGVAIGGGAHSSGSRSEQSESHIMSLVPGRSGYRVTITEEERLAEQRRIQAQYDHQESERIAAEWNRTRSSGGGMYGLNENALYSSTQQAENRTGDYVVATVTTVRPAAKEIDENRGDQPPQQVEDYKESEEVVEQEPGIGLYPLRPSVAPVAPAQVQENTRSNYHQQTQQVWQQPAAVQTAYRRQYQHNRVLTQTHGGMMPTLHYGTEQQAENVYDQHTSDLAGTQLPIAVTAGSSVVQSENQEHRRTHGATHRIRSSGDDQQQNQDDRQQTQQISLQNLDTNVHTSQRTMTTSEARRHSQQQQQNIALEQESLQRTEQISAVSGAGQPTSATHHAEFEQVLTDHEREYEEKMKRIREQMSASQTTGHRHRHQQHGHEQNAGDSENLRQQVTGASDLQRQFDRNEQAEDLRQHSQSQVDVQREFDRNERNEDLRQHSQSQVDIQREFDRNEHNEDLRQHSQSQVHVQRDFDRNEHNEDLRQHSQSQVDVQREFDRNEHTQDLRQQTQSQDQIQQMFDTHADVNQQTERYEQQSEGQRHTSSSSSHYSSSGQRVAAERNSMRTEHHMKGEPDINDADVREIHLEPTTTKKPGFWRRISDRTQGLFTSG